MHAPLSPRVTRTLLPPLRSLFYQLSLEALWLLTLVILFGSPSHALSQNTPSASPPPRPFAESPHDYWKRPTRDPFSSLLTTAPPSHLAPLSTPSPAEAKHQLRLLLDALHIPESSQLLVYSATSLQSGLIHPSNPRALYFNEDTYIGFVPGGRLEVASIDPELGPLFYVSTTVPSPTPGPAFTRSQRCMNCHAGRTSQQLPGMVAESVICTQTGASLDGFRREQVGHHIPLSERFGGWHLTGFWATGPHLGNLVGESAPGGYRTLPNPPGSSFRWDAYLTETSDILPHLLHEHQLGFHNALTLLIYRAREALSVGQGQIHASDQPAIDALVHRLLRYVLFADEAPLPPKGLQPNAAAARDFLSKRVPTQDGKSLRDLDLSSRLLRYRCSYMLYTPAFRALPRPIKQTFITQLSIALQEHAGPKEFDYLPPEEKRAIRTILIETKALQ